MHEYMVRVERQGEEDHGGIEENLDILSREKNFFNGNLFIYVYVYTMHYCIHCILYTESHVR